jgi:small subunit ribosomal protein S4
MARYTGPKTKIARKFGEPIFGEDKSFEKRNYPPGQHGNARRRGKKIGICSTTYGKTKS